MAAAQASVVPTISRAATPAAADMGLAVWAQQRFGTDRFRGYTNTDLVGVELAGALGEIANDTLRHDFRHIVPSESRILLLEGGDRVLPAYPADLSAKAEESLIRIAESPDHDRAFDGADLR